jgi:hypothetical protein
MRPKKLTCPPAGPGAAAGPIPEPATCRSSYASVRSYGWKHNPSPLDHEAYTEQSARIQQAQLDRQVTQTKAEKIDGKSQTRHRSGGHHIRGAKSRTQPARLGRRRCDSDVSAAPAQVTSEAAE